MQKNIKIFSSTNAPAESDTAAPRIPVWTEFSPDGVRLTEQRASILRDQSVNTLEIAALQQESAVSNTAGSRSNRLGAKVAAFLGRAPMTAENLPLNERWQMANERRDLLAAALVEVDADIAKAKGTAAGEAFKAVKPYCDTLLRKKSEALLALCMAEREIRKFSNRLTNNEINWSVAGYLAFTPAGNPLDPYGVWNIHIRRAIECGYLNADDVLAELGGKLK